VKRTQCLLLIACYSTTVVQYYSSEVCTFTFSDDFSGDVSIHTSIIHAQIPNYWEPSKKLLNDPGKFLESLLQYDKDNISEGIIKRVEPHILVCGWICKYVCGYHFVCVFGFVYAHPYMLVC